MNIELPDADATEALGGRLAELLAPGPGGWLVTLDGSLGAGKTTLARGFLRALGYSGRVPSPTYTLVEPYEVAAGNVYHVDLYRVASEDELRYLGWSELDSGLRLVEWPDRAPGILSEADLVLTLEYAGGGRSGRLEPLSPSGEAIIDRIQAVTEPLDE